ncbi:MAG: sugar ABC transporter permease [Microbacteriaceae bacterium]|nr:MAG: sugar ABC transporter permease [Microbacteriaceae bacterium]
MTTTVGKTRMRKNGGAVRSAERRRAPRRPGDLIFVVPAVVLEAAVLFLPLVYVLWRSFYNWQPGAQSPFIGFGNYLGLFTDPGFWQVVGNELFFLLGLPLWVIAPLVVAYMLRERVALPGLWRSIYFLPSVMSPAIVGLVFSSLLAENGPIDGFLNNVGLGALALPWLTDAALVKPVIIVLVLWAGFGTGVLIFSASFGAVPQEVFEAARLDGAGFWRELWSVAMPMIRPTVVLWTMYQVVAIFLFMFAWIFVLTGGGPGLASTTLDFSVFQKFMRFGFFGSAAAESILLILMVVLIPVVFFTVGAAVRAISRSFTGAKES